MVAIKCKGPTSVKFFSDNQLGALYIAGDSNKKDIIKFALHQKGKWTEYSINPRVNKVKYISLGNLPPDELTFACGDTENFFFQFF